MVSQLLLTTLLQFALSSIAMAAPITIESNSWQAGTGGGVIGFIVFILDVIFIVEVIKSNRPVSHKLLWSLLIFFFPILGIIIYLIFSNRAAHGSQGYEPIAN